MMSAFLSPSASRPHCAQVSGMNCIGPSAPADDGPTLRPWPLSTCPIAARIVHDNPRQVRAAAWYSSIYVRGLPECAESLSLRIATMVALLPPTPRARDANEAADRPGAESSTPAEDFRPSNVPVARDITTLTFGRPNDATAPIRANCAPTGTC